MSKQATGFIGTYTEGAYGGRGRGIYSFTLDGKTLEGPVLAAEARNPSYLALGPSKKTLYAVNELAEFEGTPTGALSAFAVEGGLRFLNQQKSGGRDPCHIAIDARGAYGVVSNYTGGTLGVFPLEKNLGEALQVIRFSGRGPNPRRQEGPHAHSFIFDREQRRGFCLDLGTDRIMAYDVHWGASKPLVPAAVPWFSVKPGAGPRHGVFDPSGEVLYLANELDASLDVLRYIPASGGFEPEQTLSTLPQKGEDDTAAAVRLGPGGKFLYVSNRGHNSIAWFRVGPRGLLTPEDWVSSQGRTPRDFCFSPGNDFLVVCNQHSDNLVVFRVDSETGKLTPWGEYPVPTPVCVVF
ncbi:lactonase family protein [Treponema sp. TIM-1]|uniref:lactonase family protein n=1 Tax=Treponema sp. TIM-1 TaxID=2898417 RepID=UPI0039818A83